MQSPIFLSLLLSLAVHTVFGYILEHVSLVTPEQPAVRKPEPLKMVESKIVSRSSPAPRVFERENIEARPDYEPQTPELEAAAVEDPPLQFDSADVGEPASAEPIRSTKTPAVAAVEVQRVEKQNAEPTQEQAEPAPEDEPSDESSTPVELDENAENPPPAYPALARRLGYEGVVVLLVTVSADGASLDVTIKQSSGHRALDEAAVSAILQWKFKPAIRNGEPTEGRMEVPVRFRLE